MVAPPSPPVPPAAADPQDMAAFALPSLDAIAEDYELLDSEDRYRLLIDLGRALPPMDPALQTEATRVRGCSASVWVYPLESADGRLRFLADSNAAITKGVVALVLAAVGQRPPAEVASLDIAGLLAPFALDRELSSNRTQGIPNMIALVRDHAARLAAAS
jgi:cysteine desulfuration protein SufE